MLPRGQRCIMLIIVYCLSHQSCSCGFTLNSIFTFPLCPFTWLCYFPTLPTSAIFIPRCLAAQLALGKPIFCGRTRKQQLEYVFKCCGSPGQGRWPDGNKAPLYRHLRPVDDNGKSLHFKPRLDKVRTSKMYHIIEENVGMVSSQAEFNL